MITQKGIAIKNFVSYLKTLLKLKSSPFKIIDNTITMPYHRK
ncbi:hypothetical protein [Kordia zhangzhouensis]|nr:hypothetical protein [Kordia zhangzhouensis]